MLWPQEKQGSPDDAEEADDDVHIAGEEIDLQEVKEEEKKEEKDEEKFKEKFDAKEEPKEEPTAAQRHNTFT